MDEAGVRGTVGTLMNLKRVYSIAWIFAAAAAGAQTPGVDQATLARANGGDAAAQIAVGESYAAGNGVARDCKAAGEWFRKATESGSIQGELRLAAYYRDGAKGCPRDMAQAAQWYRKAAEQGDVRAEPNLLYPARGQ